MFSKDRKLFVTLILMFIIVAALVIVSWLYENRNQDYENLIEATNKSYGELQKENEKLIENNKALSDENEKLKNKLGDFNEEIDLASFVQSLNELSDISLMIKQGDKANAKEELNKIDPSGLDNSALSFYESLCRELNIQKENKK